MTVRHNPPANDRDFERLCLALLRRHWDCLDLQLYGRKGQEQHGVDIVDSGGASHPRAAQCKTYNPLQVISPAQIAEAVEKARTFRPELGELVIITTATLRRDATDSAVQTDVVLMLYRNTLPTMGLQAPNRHSKKGGHLSAEGRRRVSEQMKKRW